MSGEEIENHDGLENFEASFYSGSQRQCTKDGCSLGRTQAEEAYEALMSGLPEPTRDFEVPNSPNPYVTPTQETFNMVLRAIRPPNEHAIQPIANTWRDLSRYDLKDIEADLKNATETLANSWVGDDFDSLEDNMNTTLSNLGRTREKIIDLADELDEAASNLKTHQALEQGETPFPPAGFNLVGPDDGCCDDYKLHVRAPWKSGDCDIFEGGDEIAEVMVIEGSEFATSEREWIETEADRLVTEGGYAGELPGSNIQAP